METNELEARLKKTEARLLGLISIAAAMLKHHPGRDELQTSLGLLAELHECVWLPTKQDEGVARAYRKTIEQVQQLSLLEL